MVSGAILADDDDAGADFLFTPAAAMGNDLTDWF